MNPEQKKNLCGLIGLCRSAGKLIIGVPMICEQMRKGNKSSLYLVIEASDTSENTHKKITCKCDFYGVRHERVGIDCDSLGHAVGKSAVGAVAVIDANLCRAILNKLDAAE